MRVFLDANILVSVLNKEYPLYTWSSRILSLAGQSRFSLYTSPVCLAIAFYFSEKKSGPQVAKRKIELLAENLLITEMNKSIVMQAVKDNKVHDFEDGIEYFAAKACKCNLIVTEDIHDFYFSDIEVMNARQFFESILKG